MIYTIIKDKCSSCGLCADVCPAEAISQIGPYVIDPLLCIKCGDCLADCPSQAIELQSVKKGYSVSGIASQKSGIL